jgi:hypothetical protein
MRLVLLFLLALCVPAWAGVDKLPASHDTHVAQVEAERSRPPKEPDWAGRPGTIKYALTQADGTRLTLDAVKVASIYKVPQSYFVIRDWYTISPTIIVNMPAPAELWPGQTIDVTGTVESLSDGRKILEYPTIIAYTKKNGDLLVRGGPLIKGIFAVSPWPYKKQLAAIPPPTKTFLRQALTGVKTMTASMVEASPTTPKDLSTYDSIDELIKAAPVEGKWIRLHNRHVYAAGTDEIGTYIIAKDDPGETMIKVYTTARPKTRSSKLARIIGKIHLISGVRVIITDSGPTFDPQLGTGSVWIID